MGRDKPKKGRQTQKGGIRKFRTSHFENYKFRAGTLNDLHILYFNSEITNIA